MPEPATHEALACVNGLIPTPPGAPGELRLLKAGRGPVQPDVWIVDGQGRPRVWKTYWRKFPPWRATGCKWLAAREGRILRRLADVRVVPRFLSHPQPWTLEMSLLDAEPVPEMKGGDALSPLYFDRLWAL